MSSRVFKVWRGDKSGGRFVDYQVQAEEGMVVLDAIHQIQRTQAPDLACRWNCKAAKCGSCGAEVNGKPRLMCKTRLDALPPGEVVSVRPMRSFPLIRDLVTDVSWNFQVNQKIPPFTPRPDATWIMQQEDVDRVQEFRKCIECFLCQNVCHVLFFNVITLTAFTFGCNSCRHLIGGQLNCFSCSCTTRTRYKLWRGVSVLNLKHMEWAWVSLFAVGFADLYIRLCAMGIWHDVRLW